MAQFQAYSPQVMVNGQTVLAVLTGMGAFKSSGTRILEKHGIPNPVPTGWYPQQAWLNAFKEIAQTIGAKTLQQIGASIPRNAKFPPGLDSLDKALQSLDVAYHLNHKGGEIGHYQFTKSGAKQGIFVCRNPYPCEFDRGILEAMVAQFKPTGTFPRIEHDPSKPCRAKQGDSCTYTISW